jgi:hypothetical protein
MNIINQTPNQELFAKLEINTDEISIEQLAEYTAVEYFLTVEDEPSPDADNLQKINRYLEALEYGKEAANRIVHLIATQNTQ